MFVRTVGDASAYGLTLAPLAVTNAQLMGEITRQSGNGLKNLGILFSNFLQGKNQVSRPQFDSAT
jgi:hypothetical protein